MDSLCGGKGELIERLVATDSTSLLPVQSTMETLQQRRPLTIWSSGLTGVMESDARLHALPCHPSIRVPSLSIYSNAQAGSQTMNDERRRHFCCCKRSKDRWFIIESTTHVVPWPL